MNPLTNLPQIFIKPRIEPPLWDWVKKIKVEKVTFLREQLVFKQIQVFKLVSI